MTEKKLTKINQLNFINPGENIEKGDGELTTIVNLTKEGLKKRWEGEFGSNILAQWKASGFNRQVIEERVGKYYGQLDLRGIPLESIKVAKQDFSKIDFFGASFKKSAFSEVNFSSSWLSESDIRGAKFIFCMMDEVLLDHVDFNSKTDFHGVDLHRLNFTLATLLKDAVINRQRINNLEKKHKWMAAILRVISDYGRSLPRLLLWMLGVVTAFALIYLICPSAAKGEINNLFDAFYFSVVTFTTLGYGDITPVTGWLKLAVILEVISGYFFGGLLVAVLARKVIGN